MPSTDLDVNTLDQFRLLTYLADANFRETALLHDALVAAADSCMDADKRDPDELSRYNRMSEVVVAAMRLEWPEATAAWLGE